MNKIPKLHCPISELELTQSVLTAHKDTSLKDVLEMMKKHTVGAIVITSLAGKAEGIITERDFLLKICGQSVNFETTPVQDYMTAHPTTVPADKPFLDVLQFMHLGAFRHIIVVDENEIVKTVASIKDIMEYLYNVIDEYEL